MNHAYHYRCLFSLRAVSFPFAWGVNTHTHKLDMIPLPSLDPWKNSGSYSPSSPPGTQSKTSKAQQSMDLVQHWRLVMPTYTQYLTITKCTLLRLDSWNFIKLSETYFKKTDRDVVFYYIICVFIIIFPSANQLHCIYLTMISKNTEYNFLPNSKEKGHFFPAKKPGIYFNYLCWVGS